MTQLLMTATRKTICSATLIDHLFYNHFIDSRDCGMLEAGLTDHCAISVKLPLSFKICDDTGITLEIFVLFIIKVQDMLSSK